MVELFLLWVFCYGLGSLGTHMSNEVNLLIDWSGSGTNFNLCTAALRGESKIQNLKKIHHRYYLWLIVCIIFTSSCNRIVICFYRSVVVSFVGEHCIWLESMHLRFFWGGWLPQLVWYSSFLQTVCFIRKSIPKLRLFILKQESEALFLASSTIVYHRVRLWWKIISLFNVFGSGVVEGYYVN